MRKRAAVAAGVGVSVLVISAVVSVLRRVKKKAENVENVEENSDEQNILGFNYVNPSHTLTHLLRRLVGGNERDDEKYGSLRGGGGS
jgi:hypothetical protein